MNSIGLLLEFWHGYSAFKTTSTHGKIKFIHKDHFISSLFIGVAQLQLITMHT